jgi:creatinine amidohydrolase
MSREVRYERLRPTQIREAREAFSALYIPIGTIEWHGLHNPVGLDTLKAHALAVRCAEAGGGLVFPPLWFGENRDEALIDSNPNSRDGVCEVLGIPPENLAPGYMRRSPHEQNIAYLQLLVHILNQGQSLGFNVLVLVAGHYPLIDHARAAASVFQQQRWDGARNRAIPWVFTGYELVKDQFPQAGDHAAWWETSLLMALEDESIVELSTLPDDPKTPLLGVGGARPPQDATKAEGERAVKLIVERVVAQVRARVENPGRYSGHGVKF